MRLKASPDAVADTVIEANALSARLRRADEQRSWLHPLNDPCRRGTESGSESN
jgi:hypothetical protein